MRKLTIKTGLGSTSTALVFVESDWSQVIQVTSPLNFRDLSTLRVAFVLTFARLIQPILNPTPLLPVAVQNRQKMMKEISECARYRHQFQSFNRPFLGPSRETHEIPLALFLKRNPWLSPPSAWSRTHGSFRLRI